MKENWLRLIDIPLTDYSLLIYTGTKGRASFNHHVLMDYKDWEDNSDNDAMHYKNHIYIEDITDKEILLHEVAHFLEWLYEYLDCEKEPEFKARLFTYIIMEL